MSARRQGSRRVRRSVLQEIFSGSTGRIHEDATRARAWHTACFGNVPAHEPPFTLRPLEFPRREEHTHNPMNAEPDQMSRPQAKYAVRFYDSEEFLVAELADYAAAALRSEEAFVTIATPAHFEALCARLCGRGFDADAVLAEGRWMQMDCARTLDALLRDDVPDAAAFAETVEAPLARFCARHGRVRVFGEMMARLCEAGDHAGAIVLEHLWNGVFERLSIALLCAYPMKAFEGVGGREALARICAAHGEPL